MTGARKSPASGTRPVSGAGKVQSQNDRLLRASRTRKAKPLV